MKYAYLFLSIAFNVVSYIVYKSIANKEISMIWCVVFTVGLILGGINILFFTKALKNINLSIAYPVFSGTSIFLMMVLSHFIFGEKISATNVVGAVVIIAGIVLVSN
jgi:multidrug transporter EmrE-like cation transporter